MHETVKSKYLGKSCPPSSLFVCFPSFTPSIVYTSQQIIIHKHTDPTTLCKRLIKPGRESVFVMIDAADPPLSKHSGAVMMKFTVL